MLFELFRTPLRRISAYALILGVLCFGLNSLFTAPVSAAAGINQQLNFQGRLLNAQGAVVADGYYNVEFKIYQDGPGTAVGNPGGTLKWTEDWLNASGNAVKVVNGYISVQLGSITPFGSSVDWNQDTLWLSVNIGNTTSCTITTNFNANCGGDGEMLPMKRLSSVPYALNAGMLGGLTSAGFIQNTTAVQTANFNINGTGTANTLQTATLDTATAGTLNIGSTNATSINLAKNVTIASGMSLTLAGGATGTRPASPTEGMLYYDTTTKQLLVYSNGKWQTDRATSTKIVAASNSSQSAKDSADFVATGTGDQTVINSALTAASGGKVYLMEGTYTVNGSISIPNNTTLAGAGYGTLITIPNNFGADLNAITNTTTGGNGTGITIQDLRLDGNWLNQGTGANMYGIYLNGVGSGSGSSAIQGGKITNVWVNKWFSTGIYLTSSSNNAISNTTVQYNHSSGIVLSGSSNNTLVGTTSQGNDLYGIYLTSSSANNKLTGNTVQSNSTGLYLSSSSYNMLTGNSIQSSSTYGVRVTSSTNNTFTGNTVQGNANLGLAFSANANNNTVSGNNFYDNGGATTNESIYLTSSSSNTITGNAITDTSATTNNYAIDIANSASNTNYLADNTLGGGTVNDAGTGTIYGGQSNGTAYLIQPASNITMGGAATTTTIQGTLTITPQTSASTTMLCSNGGIVSTCDSSLLAPTGTNFIKNQTGQQASANFNISGTGIASVLQAATFDTTSSAQLNIGTTNASSIMLGKSGVATSAAGGLLTSSVDAGSITALTIGNANASSISIGTGTTSAAITIGNSANSTTLGSDTNIIGSTANTTTVLQRKSQTVANTDGAGFTIKGATGSGTGNGGVVRLQGGDAGATGTLGGNLTLAGGTGSTSNGTVILATSTFQTATTDSNCFPSGSESTSTSNCTIAQSSINNNAAVIVGFTNDGQTAFMPDPSILTAGRVVYVTASNGSKDFTLSVNGGGQGNQIAMRKNTTATMIWNGADWTAAGASSSTTMQAAYDNTLQSAGGAELVVSKTSATNGLTIRDSATNSVNGALLTIQSSSAANLFSVNSNVTEYTSNSGAESFSGATTTFPASTWVSLTGSAVTRNVTTANIATGQGSAQVVTTTTAGSGIKNVLTTPLSVGQHYNVSFTAKLPTGAGAFTDMGVYYSVDGTNDTVPCLVNQAIKASVWTKINCAFTASGSPSAANSINIRQIGGGTVRTFFVDNISVTIAADYNYATDGDADDTANFGTNWPTAGLGTVTTGQNTSDGYNASSSATANITAGAANAGIRNKLSIKPLVSTLYRISVYVKATTAFNDFKVRYSRDGSTTVGGNYVDCVDYSTQTISTSVWTQVTCYITTDGTAPSNPYVYFVETASAARTYYVDAFSITLASNSTPNVQIGSGNNGGPTTLFTLDKGASAPIAANNDALLGSMYYDTTLGKLQCYEADGWGACGSSPDNIITISPEYTNAVLHGTGIGTMTSDLCSDYLDINDPTNGPAICGAGETYNFYKWTSPQASDQKYSIYVTYQLPSTFKSFNSGQTSLQARVDSTTNAYVKLQLYKNHSGLTPCGVENTITTAVNTWQAPIASGTADPSTCGFAPGDSVIFKITVGAKTNANAYVGNLNFAFSNK